MKDDLFMRILHVVSSWKGGGIKVAFDVSKELIQHGYEIAIYVTNLFRKNIGLHEKKIISATSFDVLFPSIAEKMKFYITPQLILTLKEINSFDIIHFHGYRTFQNIILCHYAKKYNVPYVLQAHGSLPRIMPKRRLKYIYDTLFGYKILKNATKVIALNRVEAEQYRSMGVPEEKIAIIPNGIDLSEYAELPPKGYFKKKLNVPENLKIILYLGRIHKIKDIDFLVKAYANLINEMNCKDAVLVIAGPDDGYLEKVKSLVQGLGVSNHVLFTGPLYGEDKLAAYVDSEVYVLPSRYETFPMTVLEVYACGKPVVASKVGGLKDLVINGETGILVDIGNADQLARAILSLLNNGREAEEMGSRGKQLVKDKFSIEAVIGRLEALYKEVVEK